MPVVINALCISCEQCADIVSVALAVVGVVVPSACAACKTAYLLCLLRGLVCKSAFAEGGFEIGSGYLIHIILIEGELVVAADINANSAK